MSWAPTHHRHKRRRAQVVSDAAPAPAVGDLFGSSLSESIAVLRCYVELGAELAAGAAARVLCICAKTLIERWRKRRAGCCGACRRATRNSKDMATASEHREAALPSLVALSRRPSRRREGRPDASKKAVRRSWTISGWSSRWSAPRGSLEMRAYSSLPRHYTRPASLSAAASAAAAAAAADAAAASDSGVGTQEEAEDAPRHRQPESTATATPAATSSAALHRELAVEALSTDPSTDDVSGAGAESPRRMPARRRRNDLRRPPTDWAPMGPDGSPADLRLVFISSDSSSRDDEDDDETLSSSSGGRAFSLDWDYFDPGVASRRPRSLATTSPLTTVAQTSSPTPPPSPSPSESSATAGCQQVSSCGRLVDVMTCSDQCWRAAAVAAAAAAAAAAAGAGQPNSTGSTPCCACGGTSLPLPILVPIPVPVPVLLAQQNSQSQPPPRTWPALTSLQQQLISQLADGGFLTSPHNPQTATEHDHAQSVPRDNKSGFDAPDLDTEARLKDRDRSGGRRRKNARGRSKSQTTCDGSGLPEDDADAAVLVTFRSLSDAKRPEGAEAQTNWTCRRRRGRRARGASSSDSESDGAAARSSASAASGGAPTSTDGEGSSSAADWSDGENGHFSKVFVVNSSRDSSDKEAELGQVDDSIVVEAYVSSSLSGADTGDAPPASPPVASRAADTSPASDRQRVAATASSVPSGSPTGEEGVRNAPAAKWTYADVLARRSALPNISVPHSNDDGGRDRVQVRLGHPERTADPCTDMAPGTRSPTSAEAEARNDATSLDSGLWCGLPAEHDNKIAIEAINKSIVNASPVTLRDILGQPTTVTSVVDDVLEPDLGSAEVSPLLPEPDSLPEESGGNATSLVEGVATVESRSSGPVSTSAGEPLLPPVRAEVPPRDDAAAAAAAAAARYTSLVMITQERAMPVPVSDASASVSVVTSETTTVVDSPDDVRLLHTNLDEEEDGQVPVAPPRRSGRAASQSPSPSPSPSAVRVVTGGDTLSAVICLEEGLADDDSWVEEMEPERGEEELATTTATDTSSGDEMAISDSSMLDREEELRGYCRAAIDFTLHTIVEESCEESEAEVGRSTERPRGRLAQPPSASDLEKYFFFELGAGANALSAASIASSLQDKDTDTDTFSETNSSIYSEGLDSFATDDADGPGDGDGDGNLDPSNKTDPADLASSRLEKYFLHGFMVCPSNRRDSDGSVGSDSEGRPSPEQRRKRLVRARGAGRAHSNSNSLDNLAATEASENADHPDDPSNPVDSPTSSTDTDAHEEPALAVDGQFDTVKRKKRKRSVGSVGSCGSPAAALAGSSCELLPMSSDERDGSRTPQAERSKQPSRDSGFVGSCDDLLLRGNGNETETRPAGVPEEEEESVAPPTSPASDRKTPTPTPTQPQPTPPPPPPPTALTRKDSFNNWSSDEETNLMMSKMRAFFKTMVGHQPPAPNSTTTPRKKPPQLLYFETELTRLMKTVPGIRDDQVREIVEYLSSEDTWSDSYDSSDYTSSDLEGACGSKSALQEQISASCRQIISNFEQNGTPIEAPPVPPPRQANANGDADTDTALVYQRLVASLNRMADGSPSPNAPNANATSRPTTPHSSPPIFAKVMQHIGGRLVALMHDVSSGEGGQRVRYTHRRLQQKSTSATLEDDEDSVTDTEPETSAMSPRGGGSLLARSRSHDVLGSGVGATGTGAGSTPTMPGSTSTDPVVGDDREASDFEGFSWRGSFESALMAADSRTKLSLAALTGEASSTAAKRRSAGDLLFAHKSVSREQLDRVRSCGSIGGGPAWTRAGRRSSSHDTSSADEDDVDDDDQVDDSDPDDDLDAPRSTTLPRGVAVTSTPAGTNSLPRLLKAHSASHVQSARYRPPGFNRPAAAAVVNNTSPTTPVVASSTPKRAVSAPGLQLARRERRWAQQSNTNDDASLESSLSVGTSYSAGPSPVSSRAKRHQVGRFSTGRLGTSSNGNTSGTSSDWLNSDDTGERLGGLQKSPVGGSLGHGLGSRSDSLASVYSGAGEGRYGTVAVRGEVEFGLQYNYKHGCLEIHVKQCKDLAPVDVKRNRSDPYVKVYLLPDKSKGGKRKTRVKKHTLNPVFDETLKFQMSLKSLSSRTLWLTVWHSDMFGRNDFLGEVMMSLENKVFDDPSPHFYPLQERTEPFEDPQSYKGDMIVALKFIPPEVANAMSTKKGKRSSKGALHVLVKEAKNLTAVKTNGTSDPFCKSYLLPDKGRSSKQKTPVVRRTCNPAWNHTFVYSDVGLQELSERALELTVWDHDRLASNEFLGGLRFSLGSGKHYGKQVDWMDSTGKELTLWQRMLERPNLWVESSVSLRPSLDRSAPSGSSTISNPP